MKITNIYPRQLGVEQTKIGDGTTPSEVWSDLRNSTLMNERVLFIETHEYACEEFLKVLRKGIFNTNAVDVLRAREITNKIHIPTQGERNQTEKDYFSFRTQRTAKFIARQAHNAHTIVVWEPYVEAGDLDYIKELRSDVRVVVLHLPYYQYGVVVKDDGAANEVFDTKSEVENEQDLPAVIKGISHEGETTWIGALPKVGKTWVLLCVLLALLTGLPLFGDERLQAAKAKRCIYLCPEASRGSLKKRLKMLRLVDHLYDPITNPDGGLYLQTLSKGHKIALTDPLLLELAKGADIFIDTAVRYLEGDENSVKDVRVLTENILNLLSVGARSVWVAHHAPKGFENASSMTLQNMFRGSGEFGAALSNAYGLCTEDEATTKIRFHCISSRDLDELLPDMILQGRPYLFETGNFKVVETNAAPFKGKAGAPSDALKQQKIEFARNTPGSLKEKTDAVNAEFKSNHNRSTVYRWLEEFDADGGVR